MRKPKKLTDNVYISNFYTDSIAVDNYYPIKDIPKLIKWLEKVQKYNEFNTKKKVKPTTTELLTATKISSKVK